MWRHEPRRGEAGGGGGGERRLGARAGGDCPVEGSSIFGEFVGGARVALALAALNEQSRQDHPVHSHDEGNVDQKLRVGGASGAGASSEV